MKYVRIVLLTILILTLVIFVSQNSQPLLLTFLSWDARFPASLIIVVIYLLGTFTGSILYASIKKINRLDDKEK